MTKCAEGTRIFLVPGRTIMPKYGTERVTINIEYIKVLFD